MRYKVQRKFNPREPVLGQFACRECSKDFEGYYTYNRLVICSEECRKGRLQRQHSLARKKHYAANKARPPKPRDCQYCHMLFTPGGTRSDARFCSLKCGNRARAIERIYKIPISKYRDMYVEQRGRCAGCLMPFGADTPRVDHDHETGRVRGLLHGTCNSILGFVGDDASRLEFLAKYLRSE